MTERIMIHHENVMNIFHQYISNYIMGVFGSDVVSVDLPDLTNLLLLSGRLSESYKADSYTIA